MNIVRLIITTPIKDHKYVVFTSSTARVNLSLMSIYCSETQRHDHLTQFYTLEWGQNGPLILFISGQTSSKNNLFLQSKQGCQNLGGNILPNNLTVSPPTIWVMVFTCIPYNNLTLVCIWAQVCTWIRGKKWSICCEDLFLFLFGLHLNSGKKSVPFLVKTSFFWSSLNLLTWKKSLSRFIPPMLKIGQNWR